MSFSLLPLLAESWGLDVNSDEFKRRLDDFRKMPKQPLIMSPCGPPCDVCGDNSYECDCQNKMEETEND